MVDFFPTKSAANGDFYESAGCADSKIAIFTFSEFWGPGPSQPGIPSLHHLSREGGGGSPKGTQTTPKGVPSASPQWVPPCGSTHRV